jgi:ethanolamine utilization microcompartment shell protein EutS
VADDEAGLRIIDISTPSAPVEVGFFDTDGSAYGVYVSGSYAYVADQWDGLRIIDISTPSAPVEVGFYDTTSGAADVYVSGSYAYVADRGDGLRIIDISTSSAPIEVGFYDTGDDAVGVYVSGNYAYVADTQDGFYILEYNPLGIQDKSAALLSFSLRQNYPNPFNPSTTIRYDLPSTQFVTLKIYDLLGQEVATLVNKRQAAGSYSVLFDASQLSSGLYFYKITAGNLSAGSGQASSKIKKMVVMK